MNTTKKSLAKVESLSKSNRKLKEDETFKVIVEGLKSYDIEKIEFRSYIDASKDRGLVYEIGQLKKLHGLHVKREDLDIRLSYNEDSHYLLNRENSRLEWKYRQVKNKIGFSENIRNILKYQFKNKREDDDKLAEDSGHRIFVNHDFNKNDGDNIFKIIFLDPNHLLAQGRETARWQHWDYHKCQEKKDCISKIK